MIQHILYSKKEEEKLYQLTQMLTSVAQYTVPTEEEQLYLLTQMSTSVAQYTVPKEEEQLYQLTQLTTSVADYRFFKGKNFRYCPVIVSSLARNCFVKKFLVIGQDCFMIGL